MMDGIILYSIGGNFMGSVDIRCKVSTDADDVDIFLSNFVSAFGFFFEAFLLQLYALI